MAYVTPSELEASIGRERYQSLADRNGDGTVEGPAVESALETESGTVDLYITKWLPISSPTHALKRLVIDLAVYTLAGNHATEDERLRSERTLRILRDLQRGDANLSLDAGGEIEDSGAVDMDGPDSIFERGDTLVI